MFKTCTGKPYVKKLIQKVRKTPFLNKTLVCLTPDLKTTLENQPPRKQLSQRPDIN